jgi:hypothetical protein
MKSSTKPPKLSVLDVMVKNVGVHTLAHPTESMTTFHGTTVHGGHPFTLALLS